MKKRVLSLILSISLALPLTGCTMMTPLTAEEEKDIALYAAAAVSKYNIKQSEGVCFVSNETEAKYDEAEKAREEERKRREEERKAIEEAEKNGGNKNPGSDSSGDGSGGDGQGGSSGGNSGEGGSSTSNPPEPASKEITLSELMAEDSIRFSVSKTEVIDHYTVEGVLDLYPGNGKGYFMVTVTAVNAGAAGKDLDLSAKGLKYSCTIGDKAVMSSGNGFLPNDLNTWAGNIPAGGTKDFLLLFPFENSVLQNTSSFTLKAMQDGTIFRITE